MDGQGQFEFPQEGAGGRHSIHGAAEYPVVGSVARLVAGEDDGRGTDGDWREDVSHLQEIHRLQVRVRLK